jgi:hypothetical protein
VGWLVRRTWRLLFRSDWSLQLSRCCGILWHPPLKGVQIDDYAVAYALGVASLPYPLVAYVMGMASLLCQVKTLVACVSGVA